MLESSERKETVEISVAIAQAEMCHVTCWSGPFQNRKKMQSSLSSFVERVPRDGESSSAPKRMKQTSEEEEKVALGDTWLDEQIQLLDSENKWKSVLEKEAEKSRSLFKFISSLPSTQVFPPQDKVFAAFQLSPFDQVKVVILGQDPYHGPGQAHGLSFSVMDGIPQPASLKNIFKEVKTDVQATVGPSGNLTAWAKQGVLLLNALLTVEPSKPLAHQKRGWEQLTDACIAKLAKEREHIVFILWGKPAQEKGKVINRSKHLVITSSHPSPLGATKTAEPFIGSKCFSRCNEYLKKHGIQEIDWSNNPKEA